MNWKLMLPLCAIGPIMGAVVVAGAFPEGADRFAWLAVVVVCAWLCATRERKRALLHGAVIGFVIGASATLVQAFLVETMVRNNPHVAKEFANQPAGFDLEFFVFMLVPFIGVAGGAVTGLAAMLLARVPSRRGAGKPGGHETAP